MNESNTDFQTSPAILHKRKVEQGSSCKLFSAFFTGSKEFSFLFVPLQQPEKDPQRLPQATLQNCDPFHRTSKQHMDGKLLAQLNFVQIIRSWLENLTLVFKTPIQQSFGRKAKTLVSFAWGRSSRQSDSKCLWKCEDVERINVFTLWLWRALCVATTSFGMNEIFEFVWTDDDAHWESEVVNEANKKERKWMSCWSANDHKESFLWRAVACFVCFHMSDGMMVQHDHNSNTFCHVVREWTLIGNWHQMWNFEMWNFEIWIFHNMAESWFLALAMCFMCCFVCVCTNDEMMAKHNASNCFQWWEWKVSWEIGAGADCTFSILWQFHCKLILGAHSGDWTCALRLCLMEWRCNIVLLTYFVRAGANYNSCPLILFVVAVWSMEWWCNMVVPKHFVRVGLQLVRFQSSFWAVTMCCNAHFVWFFEWMMEWGCNIIECCLVSVWHATNKQAATKQNFIIQIHNRLLEQPPSWSFKQHALMHAWDSQHFIDVKNGKKGQMPSHTHGDKKEMKNWIDRNFFQICQDPTI